MPVPSQGPRRLHLQAAESWSALLGRRKSWAAARGPRRLHPEVGSPLSALPGPSSPGLHKQRLGVVSMRALQLGFPGLRRQLMDWEQAWDQAWEQAQTWDQTWGLA